MKEKHERSNKIKRLCKQQFNRCAYCYCEMRLELGYKDTATVEHVVPRHAGGQKKHFNEVAACAECNNKKGGMSAADWLRRQVREKFRETANDNYQEQIQLSEAYRMDADTKEPDCP